MPSFQLQLQIQKLKRNDPRLTKITIDAKFSWEYNFIKLFDVLKKNDTLQELTVMNQVLLKKVTKSLAEMLKVNRSLKKLNLPHNFMDDEDFAELVDALKVNQVLEILDLQRNHISEAGLKLLPEMLSINKSLKVLKINYSLFWCRGSDIAENIIKPIIENSVALEHLDLRGSIYFRCKYPIKKYIKPAISKNTTLMSLDFTVGSDYFLQNYMKMISNEMNKYAVYCYNYKKTFTETIYQELLAFPTVLCDMIIDYCKNNAGNLQNPSRKEVKECQKRRNQIALMPQSLFFNKNDTEENVITQPKKKLKTHR